MGSELRIYKKTKISILKYAYLDFRYLYAKIQIVTW